jgi:Na+/melibiose symporter-like transporter
MPLGLFFFFSNNRKIAMRATIAYIRRLRLFSRDVRLFLITAGLVAFAWDGMRIVLLNLYLLRLGYGPEFIGLITAVGALAFALLTPIAGALGTRMSSRRLIIAGIALMAVGFGLMPLVEFLPDGWWIGWLLVTTVVTFLGLSFFFVNGLPFMMGATGAEERDYVFSVQMALLPLAAFGGSLLAGVLPGLLAAMLGVTVQDPVAYRIPLWLAALLLVPALLTMVPTGEVEHGGAQAPATDAGPAPVGLFLAIALAMALRFGGRGSVMAFFNVYLDDALGVPTALIGALSAAGQLISVPAALLTPLLVARWGNPRTYTWGTLGVAALMLPMALVPTWTAAGLGYVTSMFFFSLSVGPIRVFSQELVRPHWRAAMAAAFMGGAGLSYSALSYAGGYVIATWGYGVLFLIGTGLVAAGAVYFWLAFRPLRDRRS